MKNDSLEQPPQSPKMRGKWLLFAGVTILAAVGAGAIAVWRQQNVKPAPKVVVAAPKAIPDEWTQAEVSLPGRIQAQKVVAVPAPIDGLVESFAAEVDQDVFEGQLLARIRNPKLDTSMEEATAELDKAQSRVQNTEAAITTARLEASRSAADSTRTQKEFERAEKAWQRQQMLFKEGATPRLTYEKAEHDYTTLKDERESKMALARQMDERVQNLNRDLDVFKRMLDDRSQSIERAKADLAAADVHSPVDGIVVARHGQVGDEVNPKVGDLFQIATALTSMEVTVNPTMAQLKRIRPGQPAAIHVAEMPNDVISGTVREVAGAVVVVEFTSPTPLIKPGLTAQVTIKLT